MKNVMCILGLTVLISCDVFTAPEPLEVFKPAPNRPPGSSCPGYAVPDDCPPFPTGGNNSIFGYVVERTPSGTTFLANARVWAWVDRADGTSYSAGSVWTNSDGEFRFSLLPDARIFLYAGVDGYNQPCSSITTLTPGFDQTLIEVVSPHEPVFDAAPPPASLTGVVFEQTTEGRRPIAGARVFAETETGVVAATTTTDAQGRYSLCRLPDSRMLITPVLTGYDITGTAAAPGAAVTLDLEMRRK